MVRASVGIVLLIAAMLVSGCEQGRPSSAPASTRLETQADLGAKRGQEYSISGRLARHRDDLRWPYSSSNSSSSNRSRLLRCLCRRC